MTVHNQLILLCGIAALPRDATSFSSFSSPPTKRIPHNPRHAQFQRFQRPPAFQAFHAVSPSHDIPFRSSLGSLSSLSSAVDGFDGYADQTMLPNAITEFDQVAQSSQVDHVHSTNFNAANYLDYLNHLSKITDDSSQNLLDPNLVSPEEFLTSLSTQILEASRALESGRIYLADADVAGNVVGNVVGNAVGNSLGSAVGAEGVEGALNSGAALGAAAGAAPATLASSATPTQIAEQVGSSDGADTSILATASSATSSTSSPDISANALPAIDGANGLGSIDSTGVPDVPDAETMITSVKQTVTKVANLLSSPSTIVESGVSGQSVEIPIYGKAVEAVGAVGAAASGDVGSSATIGAVASAGEKTISPQSVASAPSEAAKSVRVDATQSITSQSSDISNIANDGPETTLAVTSTPSTAETAGAPGSATAAVPSADSQIVTNAVANVEPSASGNAGTALDVASPLNTAADVGKPSTADSLTLQSNDIAKDLTDSIAAAASSPPLTSPAVSGTDNVIPNEVMSNVQNAVAAASDPTITSIPSITSIPPPVSLTEGATSSNNVLDTVNLPNIAKSIPSKLSEAASSTGTTIESLKQKYSAFASNPRAPLDNFLSSAKDASTSAFDNAVHSATSSLQEIPRKASNSLSSTLESLPSTLETVPGKLAQASSNSAKFAVQTVDGVSSIAKQTPSTIESAGRFLTETRDGVTSGVQSAQHNLHNLQHNLQYNLEHIGDNSLVDFAHGAASALSFLGGILLKILDANLDLIAGTNAAQVLQHCRDSITSMIEGASNAVHSTIQNIGSMTIGELLSSIVKLVIGVSHLLLVVVNGIVQFLSGREATEWALAANAAFHHNANVLLARAGEAAHDVTHRSVSELGESLGEFSLRVGSDLVAVIENLNNWNGVGVADVGDVGDSVTSVVTALQSSLSL